LAKLFRDDRRKSKGEVGCLDFFFWVNGQDWTITDLIVTSADQGPDRKITEEIEAYLLSSVDVDKFGGYSWSGWPVDEVHSASATPWTLSEILRCSQ
jgi:hypothetical protein